jgi:Tfp pilus assembly protein PilN
MIRINLLGSPKPKGGRKGFAASMPSMDLGRAGSPLLQVVAVLAIVGAVNGVYWYRLDHEKTAIAAQMQVAEQKNRELADIKARYMERQKQADAYKRRVDVIGQLRHNQTNGTVELLAMVGETVNHTEAVWLSSLQDQGNTVAIDGMALSSDAVANLISNLQKTGYFRNIEIKETMQDESVKDMQAFQFTLTCEKANEKANDKAKS